MPLGRPPAAQGYRLQLPTVLSKQLRTDGTNLSELQLLQLVHAVLAALEATGGPASSAASSHSTSSAVTVGGINVNLGSPPGTAGPLPLPPLVASHAALVAAHGGGGGGGGAAAAARPASNGPSAALSPLPASYDVRAALAANSGDAGGGLPLLRTPSVLGGRPTSHHQVGRLGSATVGLASVSYVLACLRICSRISTIRISHHQGGGRLGVLGMNGVDGLE
jgi:hypothetical protein